MATTTPSKHGTVGKAIAVLETLVDIKTPATLGDIAAHVGLPKPTTHRLLQVLVDLRYAQEAGEGRYLPGRQILSIAGRFLRSIDYAQYVRPPMQELQIWTMETVHFGVLVGNEAFYVEKLEGQRPYRMASTVGTRIPLHCTAIGKSILAYLPRAEVEALAAASRLEARTAKTLTSLDTLVRELEWVRENGFAIDEEENEEGIRCVGAPAFAHDGRPLGAVSVSGPSFAFSRAEAKSLGQKLIITAAKITEAVGGRRPCEAVE